MKSFFRCRKKILLLSAVLLLLYTLCTNEIPKNRKIETPERRTFVTWQNLCFDRCASIWLIKTFIDSSAEFVFLPFGSRVKNGIPFDVPGAELGRQQNISCFESIIKNYELTDPAILAMAKIVHDIDVNTWGVKITKEADSLMQLFENIRESTTDEEACIAKSNIILEQLYQRKKSNE